MKYANILQTMKDELSYNPSTGVFHWRTSGKGRQSDLRAGCNAPGGYATIKLKGKLYYAHVLAWVYVHGAVPAGEVDHINHDKHDNRIVNLRDVSASDNCRNRRLHKNNVSGFTGVHFNAREQLWKAQIKIGERNIHLGYFCSAEEAAVARRAANKTFGFHDNHGASL